MNTLRINQIWTLMSKYKFKADPDTINDDLSCIICNNLMVDACQSVCGCRYCHGCITEYLGNENKHCPGGKSECKEEYLVMERDVLRVPRLNNRIMQLRVLCPNESCQSKVALTEMEEHLRVCTKQSFECPYAVIGCDNVEGAKDKVMTHLNDDSLAHTHLLIESIQNLRNEFGGMKMRLEKSEVEISSLREESRMKDIQIRELNERMAEQQMEMESLRENCTEKENGIALGDNDTEKSETEEGIIERRMAEDTESEDADEVNSNEVRGERKRILNYWIKSYPNEEADFIWKIDELSQKMETMKHERIYSESFYSNNYKLCLYICLWSDDDIGLSCVIMKGDHDDEVQWPMRHRVTFTLICQWNVKKVYDDSFDYDSYNLHKNVFDRPTKDMNDSGIGGPFIDYSLYADNDLVVTNDSIVVSCVLTDP